MTVHLHDCPPLSLSTSVTVHLCHCPPLSLSTSVTVHLCHRPPLCPQTSGVVTLSGASPAPSSLVTQILQSAGTIVQQPRPAATAVTSSRLGVAGGVRGLTMTRMVNPSQIIVTGLPQGSSIRPGGWRCPSLSGLALI